MENFVVLYNLIKREQVCRKQNWSKIGPLGDTTDLKHYHKGLLNFLQENNVINISKSNTSNRKRQPEEGHYQTQQGLIWFINH